MIPANDQVAGEPVPLVRGTLADQRKLGHKVWGDAEVINLSSLRAGEGVRLDLHSEEVAKPFAALSDLYGVGRRYGIRPGSVDYVPLPTAYDNNSHLQLLRMVVGWIASHHTARRPR